MERAQDSQGASGNGDEFAEPPTPSQSRVRLDFSVPGFSLFSPTSENILGLHRSNAADRAGDDRTGRVNPEREEENVPDDQTATIQDQESTEGSLQREGGGDVVDDRRAKVDSEQEGENVVPDDQTARVEGQGSRQTESDNVVTGEMSGIINALEATRSAQLTEEVSTRLEEQQREENTPDQDGDGRSSMIHDQESMVRSRRKRREDDVSTLHSADTSSREPPLVGSKRGIEDQSAASHGQESMQQSHEQRGDDDAAAREGAVGGSAQTEWSQWFDRKTEESEKKKKAKEQRREQRRRNREGERPQTPQQ